MTSADERTAMTSSWPKRRSRTGFGTMIGEPPPTDQDDATWPPPNAATPMIFRNDGSDHEGNGHSGGDIWVPISALDRPCDQRANPEHEAGSFGHTVIDRATLHEAIAAEGADDRVDHLSSGEERALYLKRLADRSLFRRHVLGTEAMLNRVQDLGRGAPNFEASTHLVANAVAVSMAGGAPLRIPPLLVVGAPGIGKTRYVRSLAQALETSTVEINGAVVQDVGSFTGYGPAWKAAGPGRIARGLIEAATSAPIVFIDECEKVHDHERKASPLDVLLALLEPHTARSFRDEYLQVPMRADRAIWVLACNDVTGLSDPVIDRLVILHVPELSLSQRDAVLDDMMAEASGAMGVRMAFADDAARHPLRQTGLRRARLALDIVIARAVAAGRRFITVADTRAAVALLNGSSPRSRMGFIGLRSDGPGVESKG